MENQSNKTIDTLIPDINKLFDEGADLSPELLDEFARKLSSLLRDRFLSYKEPRKEYLRMSNLGKDPLQLWYDINGTHVTEPLDPATKFKFLFGDILEQTLILLAKSAGHVVADEQKSVELDGVKGSLDCTIDGEVVDVKSASTRGLDKFASEKALRSDDPFGYVTQLSGYCQAEQRDRGFFLAVGKETGELRLCPIQADDVRERISYLKGILSRPEPPYHCEGDVEFGASGNRVLGTRCSYCRHRDECWKDANGGSGLRTFRYADKLRQFTHVEKEPNVPEITNAIVH